ncbi:hypothetical protein FG386_000851 [Cryptosporidium ryanae]|uniref:uncharacterized protein n=1 Tax=Cryptosporidium ryanae TaxID=515981 RepID=UPI00351A3F4A|nr:hypothetical protein FG386_000851 [Cryptosporidium ryanae]
MNEFVQNEFSLSGNISERNKSERALNESVLTTIKRDLLLIYRKVNYLILYDGRNSDTINDLQMIHNWELWGPCLFLLVLSLCLYLKSPSESKDNTFSTIYFISVYGSVLIAVNTLILGAKSSFFAVISLIGYCVFPLTMVSFASLFFPYFALLIFAIISNGYVFRIIVNLIGNIAPEEKRLVVLFPISLFFIAITFIILVH